ncbi:zinc finger protein 723-like [Anthonomus grandis grandis]|uniref:zinc finger protein 723-like n=1 Tax=Anthonomus grandis grandis TaxID=2921223 RepID=UPI002165908D|nr:zinc finger protein 723-like [Anthonomus grandis grandis]
MDLAAYRNVVDFKNICRTCMNNQNNRVKMEDSTIRVENDTIPVLEVLNSVHEVKLRRGFPDEICATCLDQLKAFYKFKLQVQKSESVLKRHLGPFDENNPSVSPLVPTSLSRYGSNIKSSRSTIHDLFFDREPLDKVNEADIDLGPLKISDDYFNEHSPTKQKGNSQVANDEFDDTEDQDHAEPEVQIDPAVCTICNKTFKSKYILNVHLKRHKFKGQFLCPLCGKGFNSQGCLNRHTRVHTGEKNYQCEICQKRFPSSNNLNIHLRTHTGVKPYLCNLCGKAFSNRTGLNFHVRTHSKERPYACDVCGKSFGAQSHLDWHKMIHTGERPFPCDQCDKAFIKKCDLQRHQSVHTGEKPFGCTFCDKRFSTKVHLQYHIMVHTEERPHKCPVCAKGFIRRYYLRNHMLKNHGTLEGTTLEDKIEQPLRSDDNVMLPSAAPSVPPFPMENPNFVLPHNLQQLM